MVHMYFFSDTLARKYEADDSSKWTEETEEKCGIASGSFIVIYGPITKGSDFDAHIKACIHDMDHYIDASLKERSGFLPGRSITIIHKRNADYFKELYCRSADIVIPRGGRVEVEKITITGIYQVDVFR